MTWTPARSAALTAVGLVAVLGLGIGYVVQADPPSTSTSTGTSTGTGTGTGAAADGGSAPGPTGGPGAPVTPEPAVTLTAVPGVPRVPSALPTVVPTPTEPAPTTLDFTLGTFNVLGASHTAGRGNKAGRPSGAVRAVGAAALVARHGADVVGFQELQTSQLAVLRQRTGMDFYPGSSMRPRDSENSLGWRRDRWVAVERHTVDIPYFAGGRRAMPYVRLRSTTTGLEAWFANFHNPAETADFHHQERFRVAATRIEVALANRLMGTGLPVLFSGDMNERAAFYCRFTAGASMTAARGGSNDGACRPGRPRAVDWILGSRGVTFTGYSEDRSRLVDVTTDHPVITTGVRIVGRPAPSPVPSPVPSPAG